MIRRQPVTKRRADTPVEIDNESAKDPPAIIPLLPESFEEAISWFHFGHPIATHLQRELLTQGLLQ